MTKFFVSLLVVMALVLVSGCTTKPTSDQSDIDGLAQAIRELGPEVDPGEAERAARIAHTYSLQLAQDWQVTDPAIIHNAKVINGFRERGLCNDWAEALNKRLKQEGFRTLSMHWAISPPTDFRIIHHTAVISRRGDTMYDGIILDPWRYGGVLFWSHTRADDRYNWRPRLEVREELLKASEARKAAKAG
ncbi:hypothetical protein [Ruegeria sp. HKCCD8929]|uniref:hypothetical protein n=1 Tax=Ruegeria sp. HKCCD8929 TaxID=2683006 RepID=UPI0014891CAE|nr:hypothetical protein [Ruegeria sp. HKCCD8929]